MPRVAQPLAAPVERIPAETPMRIATWAMTSPATKEINWLSIFDERS
jgi:hypothetical protein